jgi:hypothetical protein
LSALLDDSNLVTSVNGAAGVVSLDTDDVDEGSTNLYHTTARARGAFSAGSNISITSGGEISATDTNTQRPIHDTPIDGATTTSISSNWAYDNVKTAVPANAVFTDTNTQRAIHDSPVDAATTTSISSNWAYDNVKTPVPSGAVFTDTNTQLTDSEVINVFTAGSNIAIGSDGTISSTDTNTQLSDSQVRGKFSAGNNIAITSGGVISSTDTDTTYSAGNGIELDVNMFKVAGGVIPSNENLNNYVNTGYYTQNSNSDATNGSNYPVAAAGVLTVVQANGNSTHVTQTYDQYNSSAFYNRSYYNGTWSSWRDLAQDTNTNITHTGGEVTGLTTLTIANDVITSAKLANEFTTSSAISASSVDFSAASIFTKTLSANTTLTFSNVSTGMVKTLVISGDYSLTLPSSVKTLNGTYSGTATNVIQLISTNGSTEIFATISNYTA